MRVGKPRWVKNLESCGTTYEAYRAFSDALCAFGMFGGWNDMLHQFVFACVAEGGAMVTVKVNAAGMVGMIEDGAPAVWGRAVSVRQEMEVGG